MLFFCNQKLRLSMICLLLVSVIFLVLYYPFIFGEQMYAYEDIGSDTIHQYLPYYSVETELIRSGESSGYTLSFGLGKYIYGLLTQYLNPSNLALLLFGGENLHIGILAATYIKYILIGLFSLFFFLRLLNNEKAAMISALLWTFSGFHILWGQHYNFLTAMVGFTACMYGLQLYLEKDRKWYLSVPCLALLIGYSYYFTYMSVWFMVAYGVLFLVYQGKKGGYILKKVGVFALLALLSACISADYLIPSFVTFFESARTGQVEGALSMSRLIYPVSTLASFGARFLSSNLLGIANEFNGPVNYYEAAILSVSFLSVFSLAFLLLGRYRWRTLGVLLSCIVLLCTPITSRLMIFTADSWRWTYILCFLQTVAIGFALREFFADDVAGARRRVFCAALIGDAFLALLGMLLIGYHYHIGGGWLNKSACVMVVVILLLYHLAFLLIWKTGRKAGILLSLIVVELVMGNYATINCRDTITVEQWYTQMYNDGTHRAVQWIQEQDDSIYRINKTFYSVYKTDSLMQGYNGMGIYSPDNSRHLVNLARSWGDADARNWIGFDGTDWLANDMLGVKYIISRSGEDVASNNLSLVYDDGAYCVYENVDWSGFGYLGYEEMAESSVQGIDRSQRALLLTHNYYLTGKEDAPAAKPIGIEEIDLLPYLTGSHDCQITETETGVLISNTGIDAQLFFEIPQMEGWTVTGVTVDMEAQTPSVVQIFAATEQVEYCEEQSSAVDYEAGRVSCTLEKPADAPISLRFDPTMAEDQTLQLYGLRLCLADTEQLNRQQQWQQRYAVRNLTQDGNTFIGSITNPSDKEAMLCIPLIYSEFWKATVDGEPVETVNVNGGLTGFMIPSGEHSFDLHYDDAVYTIAKWISWCAIGVYLLLVALWEGRAKKKQRV